jgi:hypothetical protein
MTIIAWAGELDGTWRQDCARSYQREEKFAGDEATYTERNFWGHDCRQLAVETISRGTIALDPVSIKGVRKLDFIFSSVSLKPRDERTAETYRARILCGFRDWAVNEEKEITGRQCDFFGLGSVVDIPAKGDKKFGIVKVAPGALYFGRLSPARDGSSVEMRPEELDPIPYRAVSEFPSFSSMPLSW